MPIPPKPLKIHCKNCGYKAVYNPNSDCLTAGSPVNHCCPRCLSPCEISNAKAICVGGTWVVIEKLPYMQFP